MTTSTTELETHVSDQGATATAEGPAGPTSRDRARQRWQASPAARRGALGVSGLALALLAGLAGFGLGRVGAAEAVTPTGGSGNDPVDTGPGGGLAPQDGSVPQGRSVPQGPLDGGGAGTFPDGLDDYGLSPDSGSGGGTGPGTADTGAGAALTA